MKKNEMLTLGTIVYLKEGNRKIMVIGRGVVYNDDSDGERIADYVGCEYPVGLNPKEGLFFNQENVDEVLFEGYHDEDEDRYRDIYHEWIDGSEIKKAEI